MNAELNDAIEELDSLKESYKSAQKEIDSLKTGGEEDQKEIDSLKSIKLLLSCLVAIFQ